MPRSSGLVLHPTSIPTPWGIGDLGPAAFRFVDFLHAARQGLWQILPLGPTSYGDSPYQCLSAFAGNPLLIGPDLLLEQGYLTAAELADHPAFPDDSVDYCAVTEWKTALLQRAFAGFRRLLAATPASAGATGTASPPLSGIPLANEFAAFCQQNRHWLDDYATFSALKTAFGGLPWNQWPGPFRLRDGAALAQWQHAHAQELALARFIQFEFFRQWHLLKNYANRHGIRIIGDLPIFVAFDSADVWANQHLFELDAGGNPTVVAGVPPDYFSATGQRWGNPLYRWQTMAQDDYGWWRQRLAMLQTQVDCMRIDHFCGFENYWEIPASESTAVHGRWMKGPGQYFFSTIRQHMGQLPIIAEDLGILTPEVVALRDDNGLPGMRVLHYAFGSGDSPYLPHNYCPNCVAYTGTHDNNTTRGWFDSLQPHEREHLQQYFGREFDSTNISFEMTRAVWHSGADTVLIPLQDALNLDQSARMNYPGSALGNWCWRYADSDLDAAVSTRLAELTLASQRA